MVSEKAVGMKKSNPLHFSNYTPLRRWWGGDLLQQMALHIKYGTEQKLYSVVQASEKITEPTELRCQHLTTRRMSSYKLVT